MEAVTVEEAEEMARKLEKREANFLKIPNWAPCLAMPGANFLDVTVVMELIRCLGYTPELVKSFSRSFFLSKSSFYTGSVFILCSSNHYTTYALRNGVWWYHDSLEKGARVVTQRQFLCVLSSSNLCYGSTMQHGRRVIYFNKFL